MLFGNGQRQTFFRLTHIFIYSSTSHSICLLEQPKTIDKTRLEKYLGKLSFEQMTKVNIALLIALALTCSNIGELRNEAVAILRKRWKENRRRKGERTYDNDDGCIGIGTSDEETETDGSAGNRGTGK